MIAPPDAEPLWSGAAHARAIVSRLPTRPPVAFPAVPRTPLLTRVVAACQTAARARADASTTAPLDADSPAPNDRNAITRRHFVGAAAAGVAGALAACAGPESTLVPVARMPNT